MQVKPIIILNKPQLAENIGFVARNMMNFGLNELRLIAPRDGWPQEKSLDVSKGGREIVESAKVFGDLTSCIADLTHVYATTARIRDMQKPALNPKEFASEVSNFDVNIRCAIMFGQENNGLSNEDVSHCHKIIEIPANPEYSSINLAISVAIIGYELFCANYASRSKNNQIAYEVANLSEMTFFYKLIESKLDNTGFFSVPDKKDKIMINIRNIFSRVDLSNQELKTLIGIIRG